MEDKLDPESINTNNTKFPPAPPTEIRQEGALTNPAQGFATVPILNSLNPALDQLNPTSNNHALRFNQPTTVSQVRVVAPYDERKNHLAGSWLDQRETRQQPGYVSNSQARGTMQTQTFQPPRTFPQAQGDHRHPADSISQANHVYSTDSAGQADLATQAQILQALQQISEIPYQYLEQRHLRPISYMHDDLINVCHLSICPNLMY